MGHGIFGYSKFFAQSCLNKNTQLYRIFTLKRFNEMLDNKAIYFRKVVKWADTFEYPIRFMPEDRRNAIEKNLFGLCLTKTYDKEAMWKLYSGEQAYGVCIKTTAQSICRALDINCEPSNPDRSIPFIGNVKYVSYLESEPSHMFDEEDKIQYPDYMYPAYIKRDAFSYEEEVRIMILKSGMAPTIDGISIPLLDFSFIHEIILSPYYPEKDILSFKSLCKDYGLAVQIRQSDFLREIDENSVELPPNKKIYWGLPRDFYDILSS